MPDPTELTTTALLREIGNLEEKLTIRIEGVVAMLDTRLEAIDRATEIFKADLTRVPTQLDRAVTTVRELTGEKLHVIETRIEGMQKLKTEQFEGIQTQFAERDLRMEQQYVAAKEAVAAALLSAKETGAEQAHSIRVVTEANQAQISDIKERLTRIEAIAIGQASQKQETHQTSSAVVGLIALVVTVLSVLIGLAFRFVGK